MPSLRRPWPWFILWLAWFAVLWFLSGRPLAGPQAPPIPFYDKVLHFGYFFGGAGLLSAALFFRKQEISWPTLHLVVATTLFLVGSTDEWHQSWYEFRSGNDAGDLTADFLGALAGTFVFRWAQPRVFPSSRTKK
ncbi:MAG: VanZ family protein [Verrucomicrobiota bacterium JB023]|nr:VanZ family protein [Verrucomicrobiota bacterium JB023]